MKLVQKSYGGVSLWVREGTTEPSSDEQGAEEVLAQHAYVRPRLGFNVLPGELWLDLGANIGAFAAFCRSKGATAECYEPEQGCYEVLKKNAGDFTCWPFAVTASTESTLQFRKSKNPENNYRGTVLSVDSYQEHGTVANLYAGLLLEDALAAKSVKKFTGIKCDTEGSEFGLIDNWLFPPCQKLVFEYHHSRDKSVENLARRLGVLKERFNVVKYPAVFDALISQAQRFDWPRYDQIIFCWEPK